MRQVKQAIRKIVKGDAAPRSDTGRVWETPPELLEMKQFAMTERRALRRINILAQDVLERGIAGDFVECGVCNGGSAAAAALALRGEAGKNRRIWLYDSFEGLPAPTEGVDGAYAEGFVGACLGSEDLVREAMSASGRTPEQYVIRKGWFQDTFKTGPEPETIAYLHADGDWYESVLLTLQTFYDRVSPGGTILLDDFGHWEGAREAFYDFTRERDIKPLLERTGYSQAYWIKDREHNRPFSGWPEVP